jgi:hypothetical protein
MPVRSLTYKFLNTVRTCLALISDIVTWTLTFGPALQIVDDFFSFVIKMPLLHRLACFRDDVVVSMVLAGYLPSACLAS